MGILLISSFSISLFDYYYSFGGKPNFFGGGYGSIITVIMSCCIFSIFYDLDIKNDIVNNVIGYLGALTLEIYLGYIIANKITNKIINDFFII